MLWKYKEGFGRCGLWGFFWVFVVVLLLKFCFVDLLVGWGDVLCCVCLNVFMEEVGFGLGRLNMYMGEIFVVVLLVWLLC